MAKFKVGDRARYIGCQGMHPHYYMNIGNEVVVIDTKLNFKFSDGLIADACFVTLSDGNSWVRHTSLEPIQELPDYTELAKADVKRLMDKIKKPIVA